MLCNSRSIIIYPVVLEIPQPEYSHFGGVGESGNEWCTTHACVGCEAYILWCVINHNAIQRVISGITECIVECQHIWLVHTVWSVPDHIVYVRWDHVLLYR